MIKLINLILLLFLACSSAAYATEANTFNNCSKALRVVNDINSVPKSFINFNICLNAPIHSTFIKELKIKQLNNFLPIDYTIKFSDGSISNMALNLISSKSCVNKDTVILRKSSSDTYSGKTCTILKSLPQSAVELVTTYKIPTNSKIRIISRFVFTIETKFCADFISKKCAQDEFTTLRFMIANDDGHTAYKK